MDEFERDPLHNYRAALRMAPTPDELSEARRSIETHMSTENLRESYSLELNFTHGELRVVAHAGTIASPYKTESPGYLSVDYMEDGHEMESSISVHLPFVDYFPPKIRDHEIKDKRLAKRLGATASRFLLDLVDNEAEIAEHGHSDMETQIDETADMMLDIIHNGVRAARSYMPVFDSPELFVANYPKIQDLVTALRTSLSGSTLPQHFITHQAPKLAFMTAGGIIVTPSFERRVTRETDIMEIHDIYQVELESTVPIEEEGQEVPLKVVKTLCLPHDGQAVYVHDSTPPLPKYGSGISELGEFMGGKGRHASLIDHSTRNAVRGDLNYFLNLLKLAPKPE